ncbi:hypothetical protein HYPSUDRAFT_440800 [Hypholoma sublateritium FD-334 SS-4]|uniref:F-box domain-containing protein n=1 Tax=Hypholoma sublateritium (strain FD-334 SS-4) TaxID=945553 RepID=A0A0D2P2N3_HYPSF|nr:hypothetical protein HYPSUDRAFT_440800 [Hypholoma sublateritium FD-334 SS-4]
MFTTFKSVYQGVSQSTQERITRLTDTRASAVLEGRASPRSFADLMEATPLELKLEHIYPLLDLADLVHLTQTSRELKDLLLAPYAQSVWRAARAKMRGLPECPDDLSEGQYADLLFGKGCHMCNSEKGEYTFWEVRLRMCYTCLSVEGRVISSYLRGSCYTRGIYPEELAPILPMVVHRSGNIVTYFTHSATATTTLQAYAAVFRRGDSKEAARWLSRTMEALEPLYAVRAAAHSSSTYLDYDCSMPKRARRGFMSSTGKRRWRTGTSSSGRRNGSCIW